MFPNPVLRDQQKVHIFALIGSWEGPHAAYTILLFMKETDTYTGESRVALEQFKQISKTLFFIVLRDETTNDGKSGFLRLMLQY